jgi:putative transcription factor
MDYEKILDHQDWSTITLNKKPKPTNKVSTRISTDAQKQNKIEKKVDEDDLKHKKIDNDLRVKIIQTRNSRGLNQKQLANKVNFPVSVISDIESGKAIYNDKQINKIKRFLKI